MAGIFHEDHKIFFIISRSLLLRMTNVSEKFVEVIKTYILCSIKLFSPKIVLIMR